MYKFRLKNQKSTLGYQKCMNLKQHVPGHDTSVIDELDKEANVNEQTTTIKHSQMVESSVVQTEVSQNDKS